MKREAALLRERPLSAFLHCALSAGLQGNDGLLKLLVGRKIAKIKIALAPDLGNRSERGRELRLHRLLADAEAAQHVAYRLGQAVENALRRAHVFARPQGQLEQCLALGHPLQRVAPQGPRDVAWAVDQQVRQHRGVLQRRVAALAAGPPGGVGRVPKQDSLGVVVGVALESGGLRGLLLDELPAGLVVQHVIQQRESATQRLARLRGAVELVPVHALALFGRVWLCRRVAPVDEGAGAKRCGLYESGRAALARDGVHGRRFQGSRHLWEPQDLEETWQRLLLHGESKASLFHAGPHH
mmetsp:Transcript_90834/g.236649  ORF Transcript_90834/g.236649 Transcript_90834/m.236649 type:complete len:298 (-) Transcript_90834:744-1637(-)